MELSKFLLVLLLVSLVLVTALAQDETWELWKAKHKKKYKTSKEETFRKSLWSTNVAFIKQHNEKKDKTFTLSTNEYADLAREEFDAMKGGIVPEQTQGIAQRSIGQSLPRSLRLRHGSKRFKRQVIAQEFDMRPHRCTPAIKNQGKCGSCYSFAAISPLEFQYCKQKSLPAPISFSEQQIVDCAKVSPYNNQGCSGGKYYTAWDYLRDFGVSTSTSYPNTATNGSCITTAPRVADIKVQGWQYINPVNESVMAQVVALEQPLAIMMNVSNPTFNFYSGGVFNTLDCARLYTTASKNYTKFHAMNIVGYGTHSTGTQYWIIRNSWGTSWGLSGYGFVERGTNMCHIGSYAYYPFI